MVSEFVVSGDVPALELRDGSDVIDCDVFELHLFGRRCRGVVYVNFGL